MTTAATALLGLALPVTGELSGTWGDTVNNSITSLLDSAVAGTTTLSIDADIVLSTTALVTNEARSSIILWTAGGTVTRTITAPAASKAYIVINKTSSTQSIKIVGVGPTTGVTVLAGTKALVAWNGADFVAITSSVINLTSQVTGTLPIANGGTNATTASGARTSLGVAIGTDVPSPTGTGASGTWGINISGNAATATSATTATSLAATLAITGGGTGATTAGGALTNLGAYAASNPNGYTTNTGTVTSVTAGTGLSGGTITTSGTVALANTTVTAGAYTNASITVDAQGRLTAASTGTTGGGGTVTSVVGTGTVSGISLSGTVTSTGNLTLGGTLAVTPVNFASQTANTFLAAPNGLAGVPSFRIIAAADVPTLNQNTTGTAASLATANYTVIESGGFLYFRYGGVNKMRLDSSGNIVVTGNVTAYGTI